MFEREKKCPIADYTFRLQVMRIYPLYMISRLQATETTNHLFSFWVCMYICVPRYVCMYVCVCTYIQAFLNMQHLWTFYSECHRFHDKNVPAYDDMQLYSRLPNKHKVQNDHIQLEFSIFVIWNSSHIQKARKVANTGGKCE